MRNTERETPNNNEEKKETQSKEFFIDFTQLPIPINPRHLTVDLSDDSFNYEEIDFKIYLPMKNDKLRKPGIYSDKPTKEKQIHNNLIYNFSKKLLKSYKIHALILDGPSLGTTKKLLKLKDRLEEINIVEINDNTFNSIKTNLASNNIDPLLVKVYNCHLNDFIVDLNPLTNLFYLDSMGSYFSSKNKEGTDKVAENALKKIVSEKVIFAATFCLRSGKQGITFDQEAHLTIHSLEQLFIKYCFNYIRLNPKKGGLRYKGKNSSCKNMMFVLYLLEKDQVNYDEKNIFYIV